MNDISRYETIPPLENDYTLKIKKYKRRDALLPHWHEHIELLYFTRGGCTVTAGGESFYAEDGDLAVVNPSELHSYTTTGAAVEYWCILIYPAFFSDVSLGERPIRNHVKADPTVKTIFADIAREVGEDADGKNLALKGLVYTLLAYLVRAHASDALSSRDRAAHERMSERMRLITDYIAESYMDKITTMDLAARCFMSEAHFCRCFKEVTGKSPVGYLMGYRVERAALLLAKSNDSVTNIATRVGFSDVNYFSRIFKRTKGFTPSEYRKKQIEGRE